MKKHNSRITPRPVRISSVHAAVTVAAAGALSALLLSPLTAGAQTFNNVNGTNNVFKDSRPMVVPLNGPNQLVAAPGPGGQPGIIAPVNGAAPILNIVAPNAAGISHNRFTEFNVAAPGLVINNSAAAANTALAGTIAGNPLLRGAGAKVILNEVIGAHASTLSGKIEIAGQAAHLIIANPNGINVRGATIVNAPRTTLTTGSPSFGANGELEKITSIGKNIDVEGLAAPKVDLVGSGVRFSGLNTNVSSYSGSSTVSFKGSAMYPDAISGLRTKDLPGSDKGGVQISANGQVVPVALPEAAQPAPQVAQVAQATQMAQMAQVPQVAQAPQQVVKQVEQPPAKIAPLQQEGVSRQTTPQEAAQTQASLQQQAQQRAAQQAESQREQAAQMKQQAAQMQVQPQPQPQPQPQQSARAQQEAKQQAVQAERQSKQDAQVQQQAALQARLQQEAAQREARLAQQASQLQARLQQEAAQREARMAQQASQLQARLQQEAAQREARMTQQASQLQARLQQMAAQRWARF